MTYFFKRGSAFMVTDEANVDIRDHLPAGNYIVKKDEMTEQLFFDQVESFTMPAKIYGDAIKNADRIMRTFQDREASTGILLSGEKGSGKTMLAKNLSVLAAKLGMPTIIITAPWKGEQFNALIQAVNQPAIVLFDEFEKVYDRDEQQEMLTLLDGVYPTKKLFILTCNDKWRIDQHLQNRPGRIYYAIDYKGLSLEFIREYCNDNLNAKQHIDTICKVSSMFAEFNFDMLKAVVEEMNRYNETPQQALALLNAKPTGDAGGRYDVSLFVDGKQLSYDVVDDTVWNGNPLASQQISIGATPPGRNKNWRQYVFTYEDLEKIEPEDGRFVFKNKEGAMAVFLRQKKVEFHYGAF